MTHISTTVSASTRRWATSRQPRTKPKSRSASVRRERHEGTTYPHCPWRGRPGGEACSMLGRLSGRKGGGQGVGGQGGPGLTGRANPRWHLRCKAEVTGGAHVWPAELHDQESGQ